MIAAVILAALGPSCWDVYDTALAHSAQLPRPAYITYAERIRIENGEDTAFPALHPSTYVGDARVQYRDDGMARVEDERFDYDPIVTSYPDPGPPELGPYGDRRMIWRGVPDVLPVIASVRTKSAVTCTMSVEPYGGRQTYHITFTGASPKIPHVDDFWVDVQTHDIWKVTLDAPTNFNYGFNQSVDLAHFEIELGYEGRYQVIQHVMWDARVPTNGQYMHVVAQYSFGNYAFPANISPKVFESPSAP